MIRKYGLMSIILITFKKVLKDLVFAATILKITTWKVFSVLIPFGALILYSITQFSNIDGQTDLEMKLFS